MVLVGKAPIAELSNFFRTKNKIYAKMSYLNPSGSIKDRVVLKILQKAMKEGKIGGVIEATSGNTGISLAFWANFFGIKATIVIPKGMSEERKRMAKLLGAEVIEVEGDFDASIKLAKKIAREKRLFYLGQFSREENPRAYYSLAKEMEKLKIDYFVAGVGTGGTLIGVARVLKKKGVKIIGVLPKEREHGIQGIGDWVKSRFWDEKLVDEIYRVSTKEARRYMRKLWKAGFLVGISSGANIKAALHYAESGNVGTVFPDSWDRYLSIEGGD